MRWLAAPRNDSDRAGFTASNDKGRWPANVVLAHDPDCKLIGRRTIKGDNRDTGDGTRPGGFADIGADIGQSIPNAPVYGDQQVETWDCVDGCPVRQLDEQSGTLKSGRTVTRRNTTAGHQGNVYGAESRGPEPVDWYGDEGYASRYFATFRYVAKASRAERNVGLDGFDKKPILWSSGEQNPGSFQGDGTERAARNHHPTVKPIELMRWLVRLVTPPDGIVLDPFAGSGSTGCACLLEALRFVGIERDPEYCKIAQARLTHWAGFKPGTATDDVLAVSTRDQRRADSGQLSMFDRDFG